MDDGYTVLIWFRLATSKSEFRSASKSRGCSNLCRSSQESGKVVGLLFLWCLRSKLSYLIVLWVLLRVLVVTYHTILWVCKIAHSQDTVKMYQKQQKRGGFAKTRLRGDKTVACYFSFIDLSTLNSPSFFPCSPFSQRSVDDEQWKEFKSAMQVSRQKRPRRCIYPVQYISLAQIKRQFLPSSILL